MLLLLVTTGQREQFIHLLSLNGIQLTSQAACLSLDEHNKTSRPNNSTATVPITEFTPDSRLCPLPCPDIMGFSSEISNGDNYNRRSEPRKTPTTLTGREVLLRSGRDTQADFCNTLTNNEPELFNDGGVFNVGRSDHALVYGLMKRTKWFL